MRRSYHIQTRLKIDIQGFSIGIQIDMKQVTTKAEVSSIVCAILALNRATRKNE